MIVEIICHVEALMLNHEAIVTRLFGRRLSLWATQLAAVFIKTGYTISQGSTGYISAWISNCKDEKIPCFRLWKQLAFLTSLKQQKVFSLYFQTFPTIGWDTSPQNGLFCILLTLKGGNKHPNFEWRGQGSGANSFVPWSYPIWAQCLNSFVTDYSQNCPSENTTYVNTKKMHEVLSQNPNHITKPPTPITAP